MDALNVINFIMLFLLMLGLGLSVNVERFKENFAKPKGVTIGVICQFVIMPPSAYLLSGLMGLESLHRIAMVIIGCCPGGAMSNILCFLFRADLDLSVAMTTASSFCAIFMMPLNVYLYTNVTGLSDNVDLDYFGIISTAMLVVAGLSCGIQMKRWAATNDIGPTVVTWMGRLGAISALGVFLTGAISNFKSEAPFYAADGGIYGSAALQVFLGIFLGFSISALAGLRKPSCVAVSIETSVQNVVLAMAIIAISFNEDDAGEAVVVPVLYMMFSTWTSVLWGFLSWKVFGLTDLPKDAKLVDVINAYRASIKIIPVEDNEETRSTCPQLPDDDTLSTS